jgi:Arc/MetJ-type ribon-helix-helix transcriptional regulator
MLIGGGPRSVELSAEDQEKVKAMVASGRFGSEAEALYAAFEALDEDDEWKEYAQDRIAAGLEDIEAGRVRPAEEVPAMLRSYHQKD